MKKSLNKSLPNQPNRFYNIYKGKNDNNYMFYLPCIGVSPKKNLHWGMTVRSVFIAWGKWFIQFNICETVSDTSLELTKEYFDELKKCLLLSKMQITNVQAAMKFIKNNLYIVQILRNSKTDHTYVRKIIASYFHNQPFIENIS